MISYSKGFRDEMYVDNLSRDYIGVIEDIEDPDKEGKVRVRVFGKHGNPDGDGPSIPTEMLPWAFPQYSHVFGNEDGGGSFSAPKVGAKVLINFDSDIYFPIYKNLINLSQGLKDLIADDYENSHVMLYDEIEQIQIYYLPGQGLVLDVKGSVFRMNADNSILINHANDSASIELRENDIDINSNGNVFMSAPQTVEMSGNTANVNGVQTNIGANPIFSAVNGEPLMAFLKVLAAAIDAKVPVTPGVNAQAALVFEQQILSQTVSTTP